MIRYINTDLDLVSLEDLTPLTAVLEAKGFLTLHNERHDDDLYHATFEMTDPYGSPEETLQVMLGVIEAFPQSKRDLWYGAAERVFNIGYDCGSEPWGFSTGVSNALLRRIADAGAALQITLYPPEPTR